MKSSLSIFIILFVIINSFAQSKEINLSEIKLCEFKIIDSENIPKKVSLIELDDCPNGISGLQIPGYERNIGYVSVDFKGVIFQNHPADSTLSKLLLTKTFRGFLPDGTYIDVSKLRAKDIINKYSKHNWFSKTCTEYLGIQYQNMKFYIKYDKSNESRYPINQEFYSEKDIEVITIEVNCNKRKNN